ncbi:hypothetical protein CCACVL1_00344 [Corchorus capsularis]|uniref:Uncharacterized protein n=1 Tax=Corchorus capsularis TaxID=210143 RepID=A0A1R3KX68_COCAP|nr:hypothetical protein CCACVL1_00344 [Corchorus capsularis]
MEGKVKGVGSPGKENPIFSHL